MLVEAPGQTATASALDSTRFLDLAPAAMGYCPEGSMVAGSPRRPPGRSATAHDDGMLRAVRAAAATTGSYPPTYSLWPPAYSLAKLGGSMLIRRTAFLIALLATFAVPAGASAR